ncbi:MAG: hypothetical protein ACI4PF_06130 [Christensenellales bacterium]
MSVKNKKYKYLPTKVLAGISALGFVTVVGAGIANDNADAKINAINNSVKTTQEYIDFKYNSEKALYEAYKSGVISLKEFNTKVEALSASKTIYDNRDKFLSEDKQTELEEQMGNKKISADLLVGGLATSLVGAFGSAMACLLEEDKKKNKKSKSSMSSYRHKDLEEKEM